MGCYSATKNKISQFFRKSRCNYRSPTENKPDSDKSCALCPLVRELKEEKRWLGSGRGTAGEIHRMEG